MECLQHAHREAPPRWVWLAWTPGRTMLTCRVVISLNPRFPRPTISFDDLRCRAQNQQIVVLYSGAIAGNDFRLHKHVELSADRGRTVP